MLLCLLFPLLVRALDRRGRLPAWLSTIIACYAIGIVVANLRLWPTDKAFLEGIAAGSMLFGLPLLLLTVDVKQTLRHGGPMLLGFGLCCLAGLLCTGATALTFGRTVAGGNKIAGMLVGLYTGGTPNVQAIGLALEAPTDYLILVQASDVLLGGGYLLGLLTVLPPLYSKLFPVAKKDDLPVHAGEEVTPPTSGAQAQQFAVALLLAVLAAATTWLITRGLDSTVLVLSLTTFSLLASRLPPARSLGNTYPLGEYFILIFCVALGLLADFRALAGEGATLLTYSAIALSTTTLLHLLLCRLLGLDRDTVILSSVAGFYGPVFVVQVAASLGNRRLLAAGIAVSLLGLAVGNYLGIGLALWLGSLTP